MRHIVSIAAIEVFGKDFTEDENRAVRQLLKGVPQSGGSASRGSFEELVRTAFEAGLVAALMAVRAKNLEPFAATLAECDAAVERAEQQNGFRTVPLDKL